MSVQTWIHLITQRIVRQVHPKKIVLFGSHAYGRTHKWSDVDLLVVLDRTMPRIKRYILVDEAVGDHIYPLDILVRSSKEVQERIRLGDSFMEEILEKGRVLYEK